MTYYQIEVKINTTHKPSYFIGSTIRGAMGYALKKVTCINPSYKCEGCFAKNSCLYYQFYEVKNSFHKYRFDIVLGSSKFDFRLYLFDDACDSIPYVLSALEMMLTKNGLTKNNYIFNEIEFFLNGQSIYKNGLFKSLDILPNQFKIDSFCPNIKIKLLTPIRIKKNNRLLRDDIELDDILHSIYKREQELKRGERIYRLNFEPSYKIVLKALVYKPLLRKSDRQNQRMNMDGIMGEMVIMGLDRESYRLLKLGEIIGVGKQTVMGLGKIEVIDL